MGKTRRGGIMHQKPGFRPTEEWLQLSPFPLPPFPIHRPISRFRDKDSFAFSRFSPFLVGRSSMTKQFLGISGLFMSLLAGGGASWAFAAAADGPVLATVNGEPITQEALAQRLMSYYGKSSLDAMINRMIVSQEAKRLGVTV